MLIDDRVDEDSSMMSDGWTGMDLQMLRAPEYQIVGEKYIGSNIHYVKMLTQNWTMVFNELGLGIVTFRFRAS